MRKLLVVFLLSALLVTGLSTLVFAAKDVTIKMWIHDPAVRKWVDEMATRFDKERDDINFELDITERSEITTPFLNSLLTGRDVPDMVALQGHTQFPRVRKARQLNKLVNLKPHFSQEVLDNIVNYERWTGPNGEIYGMDWSLSATVYYYNKEIFDEAGLDPNEFEIWEDFIAAGKVLKEKTGAYMTPLDVAGWNQYQILFTENGGGLFDKDGNIILDSEENIEALKLWDRMVNEDEIALPVTEFYGPGTTAAFKDGDVAGIIMADWYGSYILKARLPEMEGKWRIAAMPAFEQGGSRTGIRGGTGMLITKDSDVREYAIDFYKYAYTTVEGQVQRFLIAGYLPNYRPALNDPRVKDKEFPYFGNQKIGQVYLGVFDKYPSMYSHDYQVEAYDILNNEVIPVVYEGEKTPEQALKDAADTLQNLVP